jgi:protein TonB
MTGGFYQQRRLDPRAMMVVVLLHGAALTALMMVKSGAVPNPFGRTILIDIKEKVPLPKPPPPQPHRDSNRDREVVDQLPDNPKPPNTPPMDPGPVAPPRPGPVDLGPPTPPGPPPTPPPPLRTIEPARARANLGSYVSNDDYPTSAIRNEEQGTTRFVLQVGADGRVSGCSVTGSSGSTALDSTACRLMRARARFTPARDSSGNPTTDSVANAIHWVLPGG